MKSHQWVDTHVGKFLACSGTQESSDNGFIYTIPIHPKHIPVTFLDHHKGFTSGQICLFVRVFLF